MLDFILTYWIEMIFGLIISLFVYIFKLIKNYKKKLDAANAGVMVILRYEIIEKYNHFIKQESITIEQKNLLNEIYDAYQEFECCDVITDLKSKINSMPIK